MLVKNIRGISDNSNNSWYRIINITEEDIISQNQRILKFSNNQEFRFFPKNVCITDTYNNPYYPWPDFALDKYTFDLPKYKRYIEKNYFGTSLEFLPFHYFIEYVDNDYYIFNTRPLNLPPSIEFKNNNSDYNSIWVVILGDTNRDIYPAEFQKKLFQLLHSLYYLITRIHSTVDRNKFIIPRNIDIRKVLRNEYLTKITTLQ